MHFCWLYLLLLLVSNGVIAQQQSPYHVNWVRDGIITAGGISASVVGSVLIINKDRLTEQDLQGLSKNDVNRFDRFGAGNYSSSAEKLSDIPFYGSFAAPLFLLIDDDIRADAPKVYLLYGQAMSIAGGMFSLTAGLVNRKRPSIYAEDAPLEARLHKYGENSFYAGHTSATAAATFFLAKVFHDYNPDSPARPYVWAAAAAVPAAVGYLRFKAGKHFLSDNLIGYTLGAGIGILIPQLHKKQNSSFSVVPVKTYDYDGVGMVYTF